MSRRVDNPTEAAPEDEGVYRAADPAPDGDATITADRRPPGDGGTTDRAEDEMQGSAESEPTRSE